MFRFGHGLFNSAFGGGAPAVDNDFVIQVKTDNAGTSASNQFTIPTLLGGYDYSVTTSEHLLTGQTGSVTLTFSTAGTYEVRISGVFPRIHFNNSGDKLKLLEVTNFGSVGWNSLGDGNGGSFHGCSNMDINLRATGDFTNLTSVRNGFKNCTSLTNFPAIDMPSASLLNGAWQGCTSLASFPLIDLSSATNIGDFNNGAWQGCTALTSFPSINFASVLDAKDAWRDCSLSSFGTVLLPLVTDVRGAWRNNNLNTFPALDLPNAVYFGGFNLGAWQGNGVISSFATRNFYAMTIGQNCFKDTTLPTADYSDILITQNANNPNNSVTFHGGSSNYNASATSAKTNLVSTKLWTITDAGLV
jgi:hypothetical protein